MRKISRSKIIKASDIKVEGKFTLDIEQIEQDLPKQASTDLVEPQVRILQSEPEFSVIEITCSCGESLRLKCEYTATKTPEVPQQNVAPVVPQQNAEPEVTNQKKPEGEKNDAT
jgi:hypothetical protein